MPAAGTALQRIKAECQLSGYYASKVTTAPLKLGGEMLLVNVDLMVPDPAFEAWLDATGPFDAITLWFSGVHPARSMTKVSPEPRRQERRRSARGLEDEVMEFAIKLSPGWCRSDGPALRWRYGARPSAARGGGPRRPRRLSLRAYQA